MLTRRALFALVPAAAVAVTTKPVAVLPALPQAIDPASFVAHVLREMGRTGWIIQESLDINELSFHPQHLLTIYFKSGTTMQFDADLIRDMLQHQQSFAFALMRHEIMLMLQPPRWTNQYLDPIKTRQA